MGLSNVQRSRKLIFLKFHYLCKSRDQRYNYGLKTMHALGVSTADPDRQGQPL
jgi:hypothetical protein